MIKNTNEMKKGCKMTLEMIYQYTLCGGWNAPNDELKLTDKTMSIMTITCMGIVNDTIDANIPERLYK